MNRRLSFLFSFAQKDCSRMIRRAHELVKLRDFEVAIFLDSGAFSVDTGKRFVTLDKYIHFIYDHYDLLTIFPCFDVVGDPQQTDDNLKIMKQAGLDPWPVVTFGCLPTDVQDYAEEYGRFCIAGGKKGSIKDHRAFTEMCFSVANQSKTPIKIHGFGVSRPKWMLRFPYYSVDSMSWNGSAFGQLHLWDPPNEDMMFMQRIAFPGSSKNYARIMRLLTMYGVNPKLFLERVWGTRLNIASVKSFVHFADFIGKSREFHFFFAQMMLHVDLLSLDGAIDYVFSQVNPENKCPEVPYGKANTREKRREFRN